MGPRDPERSAHPPGPSCVIVLSPGPQPVRAPGIRCQSLGLLNYRNVSSLSEAGRPRVGPCGLVA